MADTTHNGWRNYATWRVNLEVLDDYVASMGLCCKHSPDYQEPYEFSKTLEEFVDEMVIGEHEGLAYDYASAFLSDVDYYEIAESQLADLPERCEDHPATCEECGEELEETGTYFLAELCDDCGKERQDNGEEFDFLLQSGEEAEDLPTCEECGEELDENGEYFRAGLCDDCGEESDVEPAGFVPDVDDRAHDAAIAANNAED